MNFDREVLELECQLRFIEFAAEQALRTSPEPALDLWVEGFWQCARALSKPRSAASLQLAIEVRRQEHSPCATPTPIPSPSDPSGSASKRPRRRPQF